MEKIVALTDLFMPSDDELTLLTQAQDDELAVGELLGHQTSETTAQYSHFADDPLRRASETIGETIAAALWKDRGQFVSTATNSALTVTGGSLRYAISKTPGFGYAFILGQQSPLLTEDYTDNIYEEYRIISSALEDGGSDLLSPAVIWLSARVLQTDTSP